MMPSIGSERSVSMQTPTTTMRASRGAPSNTCWISPGTTQKFKPGTKVCSLPALLTAEGPQGIGYSNDNVGAYAERMLLSEALLLEVPNGLSTDHAALTEPLAVGVHAVEKAALAGDEAPLVVGCGPVGLDGVKAAFAELGSPERHTKILVEPWR